MAESETSTEQELLGAFDRVGVTDVAEAIVEGYRRQPQTDEEVGWSDQAAIRMIKEEPW
ncbi:MAG: hypothetical protein M3364_02015 [Actinomycetota bacterium]|nr:hypothetical protein [Actinomycetota bacterium]